MRVYNWLILVTSNLYNSITSCISPRKRKDYLGVSLVTDGATIALRQYTLFRLFPQYRFSRCGNSEDSATLPRRGRHMHLSTFQRTLPGFGLVFVGKRNYLGLSMYERGRRLPTTFQSAAADWNVVLVKKRSPRKALHTARRYYGLIIAGQQPSY